VIAIAIIWLTTKYSTNIRGAKMDVDMVISPWLKAPETHHAPARDGVSRQGG